MPTDTFTNTNGTDLPTHDANWVTPTSGGITCEIQNNAATSTSAGAGFNANYWNATFASAHYSKGLLPASFDSAVPGVAVRIQDTGLNHFYAIRYTDGKVYAGQCLNGTPADWDSGQAGFVAGDEMELSIDPSVTTTVYLKKNGSVVATYPEKDDLTGGRPGVCSYNPGSQGLASWEGGNVGTPLPVFLNQFRQRRE